MSLKTLISKSVQYNNWVVDKYLDWLSAKSDEQLNQETPSSFLYFENITPYMANPGILVELYL